MGRPVGGGGAAQPPRLLQMEDAFPVHQSASDADHDVRLAASADGRPGAWPGLAWPPVRETAGTRTLEDRLAALGQSSARRRTRGRWTRRRTRRCRIHGTRASLRNDESALRHAGAVCPGRGLAAVQELRLQPVAPEPQRQMVRLRLQAATGASRTAELRHSLRNCERLNWNRNLLLGRSFDRLGASVTGAAGGAATGGFGGMMMVAGGRATDLRRNETRRGLGRLDRSNRSGAGGNGGRLGDTARRTRRYGRRRRDGLLGAAPTAALQRGRAGTGGWAAFCVIAFNTSPGLEMCERSILGLNSSPTRRRPAAAEALPGSPCSA